MNEKEHYEREIALLKAQYNKLFNKVCSSYAETVQDIFYIVRRVDGGIQRGGKSVLFYNKWDEKFRVVSDERRLKKEGTGSDVVGVYTKGYDRRSMIGDVCQYVDAKLG